MDDRQLAEKPRPPIKSRHRVTESLDNNRSFLLLLHDILDMSATITACPYLLSRMTVAVLDVDTHYNVTHRPYECRFVSRC